MLVTTGAIEAVDDGTLKVDVLDVAHGSCIVIRIAGETHLIDSGPGGAILEYLRAENIDSIDTVLISHADYDHVGGLSALLGQQIPIGQVVWNGDAMKRSAAWTDIVYEIDGLASGATPLRSLDAARGLRIITSDPTVVLEVIAPRTRLRLLGAGSRDAAGRAIVTNSMSVVVRLLVGEQCLLLAPGDLDDVGFLHLVDDPTMDLRCRYLVLPHHGGWMGTSEVTKSLIDQLVRSAAPEQIFVSNGRGRFGNPRIEVIGAVRAAAPTSHIACTQLAEHCSVTPLKRTGVGTPYSAGWDRGNSCAGTIRLSIRGEQSDFTGYATHRAFVEHEVATPSCVRSDAD